MRWWFRIFFVFLLILLPLFNGPTHAQCFLQNKNKKKDRHTQSSPPFHGPTTTHNLQHRARRAQQVAALGAVPHHGRGAGVAVAAGTQIRCFQVGGCRGGGGGVGAGGEQGWWRDSLGVK